MLSGNYGEENEAMKLFARILAAFLAGVVGLSLVSCGGGKNKDIEYAKAALERSGVRDVFFEPDNFYEDQGVKPPKNYYPYSFHIKEDKYYGGMTLDNPELKVQSPLYYLEWLQSGNRFLSAKAEEGSFKDDDALTKGTLVFMEPYIYRSQIYADQKGNHYYGTQESVIVYLYDLSSGNFIAKKKFYGKELRDQEMFSDSENSFENKASREEIKDWVNSLR